MNEKEEKIINDFEQLQPALEQWGEFVDNRLKELLYLLEIDHKVKIIYNFRLKTAKSFLSKALYRKKNYTNPLLEIEDKIGTRIVLLKTNDVYEAAKLILDDTSWSAKTTKNLREIIEEKPNQFDYQSVHIVVHPLDKKWSDGKYSLEYLTCEIQLRTLLQHAFAEVSHDSTYKGPYKNDKDIMRSLAKCMALMEATDDYFLQVFELMKCETRYYRNYVNELIRIYTSFKSSFKKEDVDLELTDLVLELLKDEMQISEIEEYIEKNTDEIQEIIASSDNYIVQQPVFLLINYLVNNYPKHLKDNWPMTDDVLRLVFYVSGTSYEN